MHALVIHPQLDGAGIPNTCGGRHIFHERVSLLFKRVVHGPSGDHTLKKKGHTFMENVSATTRIRNPSSVKLCMNHKCVHLSRSHRSVRWQMNRPLSGDDSVNLCVSTLQKFGGTGPRSQPPEFPSEKENSPFLVTDQGCTLQHPAKKPILSRGSFCAVPEQNRNSTLDSAAVPLSPATAKIHLTPNFVFTSQ